MESDTNEPEPVAFRISIEVWADPDTMAEVIYPGSSSGPEADPPRNRWDAVTDAVRDHLRRTFPDLTAIGPANVVHVHRDTDDRPHADGLIDRALSWD